MDGWMLSASKHNEQIKGMLVMPVHAGALNALDTGSDEVHRTSKFFWGEVKQNHQSGYFSSLYSQDS